MHKSLRQKPSSLFNKLGWCVHLIFLFSLYPQSTNVKGSSKCCCPENIFKIKCSLQRDFINVRIQFVDRNEEWEVRCPWQWKQVLFNLRGGTSRSSSTVIRIQGPATQWAERQRERRLHPLRVFVVKDREGQGESHLGTEWENTLF